MMLTDCMQNVHTNLALLQARLTTRASEMLKNINMNDDRIFYLFCACFALMIMSILHVTQQKRINVLQVQMDELKILTDQTFLPAIIFDETNFNGR